MIHFIQWNYQRQRQMVLNLPLFYICYYTVYAGLALVCQYSYILSGIKTSED